MKLDELGFVGRGKSKHRPRNDPSLYGGDYPFVQTGDVKEADLWLSHYSQTYNELGLAQSKLWPSGTLCITIAANIAETAILKSSACFPDSIVGFIPQEGKADVRFIKYFVDSIKLRMQNASKGTTQDNLSVDKLLSFDFDVPDYPNQERIASILAAYDDLVENNTRRIRILEGMAQMIYRDWFVKFHFPGHDKVEMVDSVMGPIPKGWTLTTLDHVVSEIIDYRGKTPKKLGADWSDSGIVALSALNVKQGRLENLDKAKFVSEELYARWMKSELGAGDILLTSEAPLGEVYFLPKKRRYCLSQRIFSIRTNTELMRPSLLYLALSSAEGQMQIHARASGTTVQGIRQADLRRVPVLQPMFSLQQMADRVLHPFLCGIDVLQLKNANLRKTRAYLLPKLITGEISVSTFETELANQVA